MSQQRKRKPELGPGQKNLNDFWAPAAKKALVAGPAGTPARTEVAAGDGAPGFEVAAAGLPLAGLGSPCPPRPALVETTNTAVETALPVRTVTCSASATEHSAYVFQPMCRLIGNKRNLIDFIETVVVDVRERLGGGKLRILDAFAGSSVVSRMLAAHSLELYSNDFEHYAHLFGKCFLEHPAPEVAARVSMLVHQANAYADVNTEAGIIANNYAPGDTNDIQQHERCFYTRENALRIDAVRRFIHENCSAEEAPYLLAPLLVQCSIRANTTGVFNAFMKKDGVGCWGGRTEASGDRRRVMDALVLPEPVFNPHLGSLVKCFCRDANTLIPELPELDLIYVDSPYNQHSYGSNYGLLNIIAKNAMPERVTENSGIPCDWQRSAYYKKKEAAAAMSDLLNKATARASYVLISFSDEGHIDSDTWTKILKPYHSTVYQKDHRSTMGTRNYAKRGKSTVVELLYLVWAKNKGLPPSEKAARSRSLMAHLKSKGSCSMPLVKS